MLDSGVLLLQEIPHSRAVTVPHAHRMHSLAVRKLVEVHLQGVYQCVVGGSVNGAGVPCRRVGIAYQHFHFGVGKAHVAMEKAQHYRLAVLGHLVTEPHPVKLSHLAGIVAAFYLGAYAVTALQRPPTLP